jgi:anti-anti-sigma factor
VEQHLSLDVVTTGAVTTVVANGEVDMSTRDLLRQTLTHLCDEGATVRLDLRDVSFIDSTGVNALVLANRHCTATGSTLMIMRPSDQVRRVLAYTGADAVLLVEEDPPGV